MSFPVLQIGDLVAPKPIVQGGMGVGNSLSLLDSSVAREGGIGFIDAAMIENGRESCRERVYSQV